MLAVGETSIVYPTMDHRTLIVCIQHLPARYLRQGKDPIEKSNWAVIHVLKHPYRVITSSIAVEINLIILVWIRIRIQEHLAV
jgi:hypothetical protein